LTAPPDLSAGRAARRFTAVDWAWLIALAAAAFGLYARTAGYGFIYLDDQAYVASNPYVQHGLSWAGIRWATSAVMVDNWHPLTLLVELTLSSLFGPSAGTFHLANAVLHGATAALLFAFLRSATGRTGPAAATAALWAFHPLRVESVAWIAELKDGLSGALWFACMLTYVSYARRRTVGRYAAVATLLALDLLAKPIAVVLPVVLLLADFWPLGRAAAGVRWWRDRVLEKVPLVALAVAAGVVRLHTQTNPASLTHMPARVRIGNGVLSTLTYLRQTVWPRNLGLFYPHPWVLGHPIPMVPVVVGAAALAAAAAAILLAARRKPYLAFGAAWFVLTLSPVVGLLQSGDQAHADRYTYLPDVGLTIAIVWLAADWAAATAARRRTATGAAVVAAGALAACTIALVPAWRSADAVWERADTVIPDNYLAKVFRSELALRDGRTAEAEAFARSAVNIAPNSISEGHAALAEALEAEHRPAEALPEYAAALRIDPYDSLLHYHAGKFLDNQGHGPEARRHLAKAVELDPNLVPARLALGFSLARDGHLAEAADQFRQVLAMDPHNAEAEGELADALRFGGDPAGARQHYAAAVADGTTNPDWMAHLAWLAAHDPDASPAELAPLADVARSACDQTGRRQPFPLFAYAVLLGRLGRTDDALAAATAARDAAHRTGPPALAAEVDRWLAAYRASAATTKP
jgi:tetratricopeptide (TPR) repeat protein